eukprot:GHVO01017098.1.p1 GENE.GHVO01017098.1~~GHVO01017098.1.p1  ORF type:complete len:186 (+),score=23.30 GHVO01017098.1:86-643(+)
MGSVNARFSNDTDYQAWVGIHTEKFEGTETNQFEAGDGPTGGGPHESPIGGGGEERGVMDLSNIDGQTGFHAVGRKSSVSLTEHAAPDEVRFFTVVIDKGGETQSIMESTQMRGQEFQYILGIHDGRSKLCRLAHDKTWRIRAGGHVNNYFDRACPDCRNVNRCNEGCPALISYGGYDENDKFYH